MEINRVSRSVLVLMGLFLLGPLIEEPSVAQNAATDKTRQDYRFRQDRFAIGLWVDPPESADLDERYAEIAQANFTFINGIFGASSSDAIA